MSLAVSAATGHLGTLIIERLKARLDAGSFVALARTPSKAAALGVPVRAADYAQPATLDAAFEGIDTLLLISSSEIGQRVVHHRNAIDAAKRGGVKRIVYTSLLHADRLLIDLAAEHLETERYLEASGIRHTILRNGWYAENYTSSIAPALAHGAFVGSAGNRKISLAARADYADAAVAAVTNDGAATLYELAGDNAYTLSDLAAEISKQTGRDIPYSNVPEAQYRAILESAGLPAALAASIAGWDTAMERGALFDDSRELSKLIGRPTTSLAVVVARALEHPEH